MVLGELIFGSLGCWLYFFIFGGYGLSMEFSGQMALSEIIVSAGGNVAVVELLKTLPLPGLILILAIVNGFVFSGTTYDSAAYTLAFSTLKIESMQSEPARWWRLLWAGLLALSGLGLLVVGSFSALQTACVLTALPLTFVFFIMTVSFLKWANEDFGVSAKTDMLILDGRKAKEFKEIN